VILLTIDLATNIRTSSFVLDATNKGNIRSKMNQTLKHTLTILSKQMIIQRYFCFALFVFMFAFASGKTLEAAEHIIPGGSEKTISGLLNLSSFNELDDENSSISIRQDKIIAIYPVKSADVLKITLTHPDNCQGTVTTNYCVTFKWPTTELQSSLETRLLEHLRKVDKISIWKTVDKKKSDDVKVDHKQPEIKLKEVKVSLHTITWISLSFIMISLIILGVRNATTSRRDLFAFCFWFVYSLIVRLYLVEPGQINHYLFFMTENWLQFYPKHGFTLPLFEQAILYLFPRSDIAIIRGVTIVGSLSVPMVFVLTKLISDNRTISHLAAFILALLPLHVKLSAGDSEHLLLLFFYILGLIAWIKASDKKSLPYLLLAMACTFCVIQSRPEAILFPVTYFLFTRNISELPKSWWLIILASGSVFLMTGLIHLDQDSFGSKLSTVQESHPTIVVHFHLLLTNLLGSGVIERDSEIPIMVKDALFGILPDIFFKVELWRPHYLIQWVPLVLSPFYLIGLFWNFRKLNYWALPISIIMIRLPSWLSNNLILKSGMEYFDSRYYIIAVLFQVILAAFGFYYFTRFLKYLKAPRILQGAIIATVILVFVASLPRPYMFRFTYQDGADFVRDAIEHLPENAVVTHLNPQFLDLKTIELDVKPFISFARMTRPDVAICHENSSLMQDTCKKPQYYLELAQCQLQPQYFHKRTLFDIDWPQLMERSEKIVENCRKFHNSHKLELIESRQVRLQDFGGNFYLEPVVVPLNMYKIIR